MTYFIQVPHGNRVKGVRTPKYAETQLLHILDLMKDPGQQRAAAAVMTTGACAQGTYPLPPYRSNSVQPKSVASHKDDG